MVVRIGKDFKNIIIKNKLQNLASLVVENKI